MRNLIVLFVTAVCFLFLLKLKPPEKQDFTNYWTNCIIQVLANLYRFMKNYSQSCFNRQKTKNDNDHDQDHDHDNNSLFKCPPRCGCSFVKTFLLEVKLDYTLYSLWKIWLVESIQWIHNSLWTWHDKCNICCRHCIYHVKFNVCLVTKPLGVFFLETKWLNASLLFLRMNYVKNV